MDQFGNQQTLEPVQPEPDGMPEERNEERLGQQIEELVRELCDYEERWGPNWMPEEGNEERQGQPIQEWERELYEDYEERWGPSGMPEERNEERHGQPIQEWERGLYQNRPAVPSSGSNDWPADGANNIDIVYQGGAWAPRAFEQRWEEGPNLAANGIQAMRLVSENVHRSFHSVRTAPYLIKHTETILTERTYESPTNRANFIIQYHLSTHTHYDVVLRNPRNRRNLRYN